jgi:ABC-type branched-subunit amino acid transport system ATPase component
MANSAMARRRGVPGYIIERGCIRFSGTMRDVLDDPALRKTYLAV